MVIRREEIQKIASEYASQGLSNISIGAVGSHSMLDIARGQWVRVSEQLRYAKEEEKKLTTGILNLGKEEVNMWVVSMKP